MGGSPQPVGSQEQLYMRPGDEAALRNSVSGLQGHTQSAIAAAQRAAGGYQTAFQQYTPKLNTEFSGPQFGNQLDAFSQQIVSQGQQANQQRLAAQQQQIGQQLGARSPAAAALLQAQAGSNAQLGQNPLLFQAAAQQRDRQMQEYQLGQQAQSSTNAARTQQGQLSADFLGLQNAALGQQAQLAAAPAQLGQTLTSVLAAIAALGGQKTSTPIGPNQQVNANGSVSTLYPWGA